jgi:hypothetical protein
MQIIGFAEFTVVSQNTSHIEKGERPYQIKKSMYAGEKGNFIERFAIKKVKIL